MTLIKPPAAHHRASLLLLLLLLLVASLPTVASGQSSGRFKPGDKVEVKYLGGWRPGVVAKTSSREVMVTYEFAGRDHQKAFKISDVRLLYEKDALSIARLWSDDTGGFKIKAALLAVQQGDVTLRREDMTELTVPIAKLSEGDQRFIERLKKQLGPLPAAHPPLVEFSADLPNLSFDANGDKRNPLQPDPAPAYEILKQGGFAFPKMTNNDRLGAVLPLGGAGSLLLAAVEAKESPTRLVWVNLEKQKLEGMQRLPVGEVVLDYHPPSHRLLTYSEKRENRDELLLSLWEVLPQETEVKPVVRWQTASSWVHDPWARLIDGNVVLQRVKKQEYVGWDISAKRMRYRINQESFFAPLATISGGRHQLVVPEDKMIKVYDAVSGTLLSTLPAPGGSSGVAVSRDGRQLAVLNRNMLRVWDLTNAASAPQEFQAEAIGTPFSANITWVNNERVMADQGSRGQILFSLKQRMALWKYNFDMSAVSESKGRRLRDIVDGHLVYAATVRSGSQQGLAVGAVKLPGPKVDETEATFNREDLLIMKEGSEVRLEVFTDQQFIPRVSRALEKQVADNKWVINQNSTNVLTAKMSQSPSQSATYRNRLTGQEQTVTVSPFVSNMTLKVGKLTAWTGGSSTGLAPTMFLRDGQTAQGEADARQRPNPGVFEQLDVPGTVSDPTKREGLGATNVTTRGLEPR